MESQNDRPPVKLVVPKVVRALRAPVSQRPFPLITWQLTSSSISVNIQSELTFMQIHLYPARKLSVTVVLHSFPCGWSVFPQVSPEGLFYVAAFLVIERLT